MNVYVYICKCKSCANVCVHASFELINGLPGTEMHQYLWTFYSYIHVHTHEHTEALTLINGLQPIRDLNASLFVTFCTHTCIHIHTHEHTEALTLINGLQPIGDLNASLFVNMDLDCVALLMISQAPAWMYVNVCVYVCEHVVFVNVGLDCAALVTNSQAPAWIYLNSCVCVCVCVCLCVCVCVNLFPCEWVWIYFRVSECVNVFSSRELAWIVLHS